MEKKNSINKTRIEHLDQKKNAEIFVVTHKDTLIPQLEGYTGLLVGADNHPELWNKYLCDNTGDNISYLNDSYCEMTGLYWIWKNIKSEYIGLVHYRRFFAEIDRIIRIKETYYYSGTPSYKICSVTDLKEMLAGHDLLVVKSPRLPLTVRNILSDMTGKEIWHNLDHIIDLYYNELKEVYKRYCRKKSHIQCNMFFGKQEIINHYCAWVFPLLKKLDKVHTEKTGKRYKNRELGYIAEFLFGLYIEVKKINYRYTDCILISDVPSDAHRMKPISQLPKDILKYAYWEVEWRVSCSLNK